MTKGICIVKGCDREIDSRQMCGKHHRHWLDHTPKDQRPPIPRPDFWSFVDKDGPTPLHNPSLGSCWVWTGPTNRGYGAYLSRGLAHRYSWGLVNGKIPEGLMILHHCDNPPCVNPNHLYAGTAADNVRDMYERGRNHVQPLKTKCSRGHTLTDENLYEFVTGDGERRRYCRACENERSRLQARKHRARLKALQPAPPAGRISSRMASEMYGIPKATILGWGERGLVSAAVKHGKEYWWDAEEIRRQADHYRPKSSGPVIIEDEQSPVDFYVLFGRGVAACRESLGLTQTQAGMVLRSAGLSSYGRNTICHLENGRRFPPLAEISAVACALGTTVGELLPQTDRQVELSPRLFGSWQRRYGTPVRVSRQEAIRLVEQGVRVNG